MRTKSASAYLSIVSCRVPRWPRPSYCFTHVCQLIRVVSLSPFEGARERLLVRQPGRAVEGSHRRHHAARRAGGASPQQVLGDLRPAVIELSRLETAFDLTGTLHGTFRGEFPGEADRRGDGWHGGFCCCAVFWGGGGGGGFSVALSIGWGCLAAEAAAKQRLHSRWPF